MELCYREAWDVDNKSQSTRMKCSTSLWSADMANLAAEMKRVEPYSDRFHIDVADGHYVKSLLFFPDLVKSIRPHSRLPFEVHLTVTDPLQWIHPFAVAGADIIIFCLNSHPNPMEVVEQVKSHGKRAGISLPVNEALEKIEPYLDQLDTVTLMATAMGIKGAEMDTGVPQRIRDVKKLVSERNLPIQIEVDGGIRKNSVHLIRKAGADFIVAGSLMFGQDPCMVRNQLDSL
jgi:ribulose-phosphate 3-epimerase